MQLYKLDQDKNVVPCDYQEWRRTIAEETLRHNVAYDIIAKHEICTKFIGYNRSLPVNERRLDLPLVFETVVIGPGPADGYTACSVDWSAAQTIHKLAIQEVKKYAEIIE